ncbi:class II aldolase [Pseudooceanicola sp. 216_PA32_1]|uniref:Class II aldolase n=1 Tax=Pseudooceanicola pacificus TaxID=2676438 RepID=A0A844WB84_9RHOB|nr:class II aldolase/adducin family protein [Pseudooceanicola pacificus]MWB77152.1 class II aldolase [Pseudooceanicola pacificus]
MTDLVSERQRVIDTARAMNASGLNRGTSGNVSLRCAGGFLITPTGMAYDGLTPEDIVLVAMDGTPQGTRKPSSEWRFHRDILAERPDLNAVVHTHATHCTAVAILGVPIPALHYSIAAAGGHDIRCAPYEIFGSQELAVSVVAALKDRRACLMAHHGMIACHATPERALALAGTIEELARLYLLCRAAGEVPVLAPQAMAEVLERFGTYGQQ